MRSVQELEQYELEFKAFQDEVGDLYYDSPTNRQIFTQAMFDLQKRNNLTVWELWQRRIFASVFVNISSRLEKRPTPKSRAEKESELLARDRRSTLPPSHETRAEQQGREAREQQQRDAERSQQKLREEIREENERAEKQLAEDQEKNPSKYAPQFFDRDLTPEEMNTLPVVGGKAVVLRWWLAKRREYLANEALQKQRDKFAAQAIRNISQ